MQHTSWASQPRHARVHDKENGRSRKMWSEHHMTAAMLPQRRSGLHRHGPVQSQPLLDRAALLLASSLMLWRPQPSQLQPCRP